MFWFGFVVVYCWICSVDIYKFTHSSKKKQKKILIRLRISAKALNRPIDLCLSLMSDHMEPCFWGKKLCTFRQWSCLLMFKLGWPLLLQLTRQFSLLWSSNKPFHLLKLCAKKIMKDVWLCKQIGFYCGLECPSSCRVIMNQHILQLHLLGYGQASSHDWNIKSF